MELTPEIEATIPDDKSWLMRLGLLDLLANQTTTIEYLTEKQDILSDDLLALLRASQQWLSGDDIDVGESGTLYRFLRFAAWKLGEDRTFIKRGTLIDRSITNNPEIIHWPLDRLLTLDNRTSQWASAAVLLGNKEPAPKPTPYKLQLTYEALEHWTEAQKAVRPWEARQDLTIKHQTRAFLGWLATGQMVFLPQQAEDYPVARAYGLMTPEEGEERWPSLRTHETDRIAGMEEALSQLVVTSNDHRIVQAVAFLKGDSVVYAHPEAVNKSWRLFWRMLELATQHV